MPRSASTPQAGVKSTEQTDPRASIHAHSAGPTSHAPRSKPSSLFPPFPQVWPCSDCTAPEAPCLSADPSPPPSIGTVVLTVQYGATVGHIAVMSHWHLSQASSLLPVIRFLWALQAACHGLCMCHFWQHDAHVTGPQVTPSVAKCLLLKQLAQPSSVQFGLIWGILILAAMLRSPVLLMTRPRSILPCRHCCKGHVKPSGCRLLFWMLAMAVHLPAAAQPASRCACPSARAA